MSALQFPPQIQAMFDDPAYWESNRAHRAIAERFDADLRSALASAVECTPGLTARFLDQRGFLNQLPWLAWDDDPRGGYWVAAGIQHGWPERDPSRWLTFAWCHYLRDSEDGSDHDADTYLPEMPKRIERDARKIALYAIQTVRAHRGSVS